MRRPELWGILPPDGGLTRLSSQPHSILVGRTNLSQPSPLPTGQRLWNLDFLLVLLTGHFLFVGYVSLFTIVPPYVLDRGGEEWQIGVVVGSFGITGVVVRPLVGRLIYRVGTKRMAVLGTAIFALGSVLYIPAPDVWWLVPARMIQGIGLGMAPVAGSTMVANLAPIRRRAEAMSYMGNAIAISSLYAPVMGFWLMTEHGFAAGFLYSASNALLGAILALGISSARTRVPASTTSGWSAPLISRHALFPAAVFLSYTITTAPMNTFLPLLAEDRGLGNPGLFFTVSSFTTMSAMLVAGPVADRAGRATVIIPGLLSAASAMFLLTAASNRFMFLGAGFLNGAGFGLIQPGIQSFTVDRVEPRERSSAMATLQQAWDIGGSGGAFLLGPIATALSVAATFGIVGVGALVGTAGFVVGIARNRKST